MFKARTLAILGGGPKALAICAKATVLKQLGYATPSIIVFERQQVASHWRGKHGFTDGASQLGTPPEKDIGFPYASRCWTDNAEVNRAMQQFSWHSYLIDCSTQERALYTDWVDRGRKHPTHREFADYLKWCARRISKGQQTGDNSSIEIRENTSIKSIDVSDDSEQWRLRTKRPKEKAEDFHADALIVTGPGSPILLPEQPQDHPRILNGSNFWTDGRSILKRRMEFGEQEIIIVGAGETAASIAVSLAKANPPIGTITIVNPFGVLYSRGESFTENQMFSKPDSWRDLSPDDRAEVIRRGDRGVFSVQAQEILNNAPHVKVKPGRVIKVAADPREINCYVEYDGKTVGLPCEFLISAIGFYPLSFFDLFVGRANQKMHDLFRSENFASPTSPVAPPSLASRTHQKAFIRMVETRFVGADLGFSDFGPPMHLPTIAANRHGPGFANLSCLGLLSDRILSTYCEASRKREKDKRRASR